MQKLEEQPTTTPISTHHRSRRHRKHHPKHPPVSPITPTPPCSTERSPETPRPKPAATPAQQATATAWQRQQRQDNPTSTTLEPTARTKQRMGRSRDTHRPGRRLATPVTHEANDGLPLSETRNNCTHVGLHHDRSAKTLIEPLLPFTCYFILLFLCEL